MRCERNAVRMLAFIIANARTHTSTHCIQLQCSTLYGYTTVDFWFLFDLFLALHAQCNATMLMFIFECRLHFALAFLRLCLWPYSCLCPSTVKLHTHTPEEEKEPQFVSTSFFDCCRRNFTSQREYFLLLPSTWFSTLISMMRFPCSSIIIHAWKWMSHTWHDFVPSIHFWYNNSF